MPPVISTRSRSSETTGVVSFSVPPSERDAEYFEILLYIAINTTTFDEVLCDFEAYMYIPINQN